MRPARANTLLRRFDGPLTAELVRRPGDFGLGQVPARLAPDGLMSTVCGFCSTGCGLKVHLREGQPVNLTPDGTYPVNLGMACPKGWEALAPLDAADRATRPLTRRGDRLEAIPWATALELFVSRFKLILQRQGPEAIAFLSTGQICTEEMALLGALFKFGMGGLHGDSNTRQCMATSHVAYKQSFGFDAPPYTYADFEESDALVFVGSNLCVAHPILWQRVLLNRKRPAILVIDPRRTETAMCATQHLALRPKSDLVLFYGLANLLILNGWIDDEFVRGHTTGFNEFAEFVRSFTPDRVAAETGLTVGELYRAGATIGRSRAVSFWWTMGVNQGHQATRTAQALINLALITGNVGRPGTGANSVTGQCNAMGSRLFANTSSLFGGREFANPQHRAEVAAILGVPREDVPSRESWAYDQIIDGIAAGKVKGLWVVGTNSAHSWVDRNRLKTVLGQLEFFVVQDMFSNTETARDADLVLPAAGWGEKDGTFINSERRIGVVRKVARAPGEALSDFAIFQLVAEAWGCADLFRRWSSPEAAFQILKQLSRGQPCDFSGIHDFDHLEQSGGIQWPCPDVGNPRPKAGNGSPSAEVRLLPGKVAPTPGDIDGSGQRFEANHAEAPTRERRLFENGHFFTSDGRARLIFEDPRPTPELPDAAFPFVLLTGRGSSSQWHTGTRTDKSAILRQLHSPGVRLEIHPDDASRLGIEAHASVCIESRRGAIFAVAVLTSTVQPGQVFLPMHDPAVNDLTYPVFDPYSRQPGYKHCAVRVAPVSPVLPGPAHARAKTAHSQ